MGRAPEKARSEASRRFQSTPYSRGEDQDRYVSRLYPDIDDALCVEFEALAEQIFLPLCELLDVEAIDATA